MPPREEQLRFECCFCGEEVTGTVSVVAVCWDWETQFGSMNQFWPAHAACFGNALREEARVFEGGPLA